MKNNIQDLNNYLFEQLERLNDDETLKNEDIFEKEMKRSKAITSVAQTIINNAELILSAKKYCNDFGIEGKEVLRIINHFGIKNQQRKLQEEVFELNEAITEYETLSNEQRIKHIAEEIADCYVLLTEIKEYYKIPTTQVENIMTAKIIRTLDRINKNYYKN